MAARSGAAEALVLLLLCFGALEGAAGSEPPLKCEELRLGQYMCDEPKIDNSTQEPMNCTNHTAYVQCLPAPNITCKDHLGIEKVFTGHEVGFYKPIECRNVNGYSYKVAVALSLFLGWLGADRFYLGYPALDRWPFRRLQLHHRLLRGQADPAQHHQCNLQENADLPLISLTLAGSATNPQVQLVFTAGSTGIAEDLLITPRQNGILNAR
uniref:TM2 domain containing 1 n=1 Tax=Geospiza parvula TaxID=87175 RepID=A0A8C3NTW2_GEOPR